MSSPATSYHFRVFADVFLGCFSGCGMIIWDVFLFLICEQGFSLVSKEKDVEGRCAFSASWSQQNKMNHCREVLW